MLTAIRHLIPALLLLAPLASRAEPALPTKDPLPQLINEASAEAAAGDRTKLAGTLGEIIQHIGTATDEELEDIGHLRGILAALTEPTPPPAPQAGCKTATQPAPLAGLTRRDVFNQVAAQHGYSRPQDQDQLFREFQQWAKVHR